MRALCVSACVRACEAAGSVYGFRIGMASKAVERCGAHVVSCVRGAGFTRHATGCILNRRSRRESSTPKLPRWLQGLRRAFVRILFPQAWAPTRREESAHKPSMAMPRSVRQGWPDNVRRSAQHTHCLSGAAAADAHRGTHWCKRERPAHAMCSMTAICNAVDAPGMHRRAVQDAVGSMPHVRSRPIAGMRCGGDTKAVWFLSVLRRWLDGGGRRPCSTRFGLVLTP